MTTVPLIPRHILARHFGGDERMIAAFEDMNAGAAEAQEGSTSTAAATKAIQDATVLVLSPNETFTNERILKLDPGLTMKDDGKFLTISPQNLAKTEGYDVTLIAEGESALVVPLVGTVVTFEHALANMGNYANDAAAAAGGVIVGQLYRNGSVVMVRVT